MVIHERSRLVALTLGLTTLGACAVTPRDDSPFSSGAGAASNGDQTAGLPTEPDDDGGADSSPSSTSGTSQGPDDEGSGDAEIKFDTPDSAGGGGGSPEVGPGCDKVDFLFVIDNSGSMADEQANLAASFPGFIDAIRDTVVGDYQIMAVDTDAGVEGGSGCSQQVSGTLDCDEWCTTLCSAGCDCTCNGMSCASESGDDCEDVLGAGQVNDIDDGACGVVGGRRYMDDQQPALGNTFGCVATVGTVGDGNERPMEAMIEAVTSLNRVGECNEGFLRDDAILVVTVITDEEDVDKSPGDPPSWKAALVDAKNGDPSAVVALSLVGDTDLAGGICDPIVEGGDGAQDSPRLRQWAESFPHGQTGSVCASDYTDFFLDAVAVIDTACDDFEPPG